jgi:vacuolar-type H+-ATPase subunit D/Vma8
MMTSKGSKRMVYLPIAILVLASLLSAPATSARNEPVTGSSNLEPVVEVSKLLKQIQSVAVRLNRDADTLASLTRGQQASWQSHAEQLARVKEHVNDMGAKLQRLQTLRRDALAWQERAIDAVYAPAVDLATCTQAAIEHLNENRSYWGGSYGEHVATILDRSDEIGESINNFLEYAETQKKLKRLMEKLELTS